MRTSFGHTTFKGQKGFEGSRRSERMFGWFVHNARGII